MHDEARKIQPEPSPDMHCKCQTGCMEFGSLPEESTAAMLLSALRCCRQLRNCKHHVDLPCHAAGLQQYSWLAAVLIVMDKFQTPTTSSGKDWGMRGVQTGPGAIEFTRIFLAASSAEAPLVKVMMAPCGMQTGVRLLTEVQRQGPSRLADSALPTNSMPSCIGNHSHYYASHSLTSWPGAYLGRRIVQNACIRMHISILHRGPSASRLAAGTVTHLAWA